MEYVDPVTGSSFDETEEANALDQRQQFDEERARVIGSTDSPGILGFSRRSSPLSVYKRLVGESVRSEPSLPAWLGQRMENVVSEMCSVAIREPLRSDNRHHVHPEYPFIGCHLDRRVTRRPRTIVELKTRTSRKGWGNDGTADIPTDIWVQVQHQMAVVPSDECLVAVLFGLGHAFVVYQIPRDDEFINGNLIPTLVEYWNTYVVPRVPPPAGGWDIDTDIVKTADGGNSGLIKPATPEQAEVVNAARLARLNFAQAQYAKIEAENKIRQIIGEADGISGPFGRVTYRRGKDRSEVEWATVAEIYRKAFYHVLELANPGDDDTVVRDLANTAAVVDTALGLYTTVKPGVRSIHFSLTGEL